MGRRATAEPPAAAGKRAQQQLQADSDAAAADACQEAPAEGFAAAADAAAANARQAAEAIIAERDALIDKQARDLAAANAEIAQINKAAKAEAAKAKALHGKANDDRDRQLQEKTEQIEALQQQQKETARKLADTEHTLRVFSRVECAGNVRLRGVTNRGATTRDGVDIQLIAPEELPVLLRRGRGEPVAANPPVDEPAATPQPQPPEGPPQPPPGPTAPANAAQPPQQQQAPQQQQQPTQGGPGSSRTDPPCVSTTTTGGSVTGANSSATAARGCGRGGRPRAHHVRVAERRPQH